MKNLKLRVWDKVNNCFCYLSGFEFISSNLSKDYSEIEKVKGQLVSEQKQYFKQAGDKVKPSVKVDKEPIIQIWTGRKDEDGKDIYDGDVITYNLYKTEYTGRVIFEYLSFFVEDLEGSLNPLCGIDSICKVIGNTKENPNYYEKRRL